jgi:hypothetical protein
MPRFTIRRLMIGVAVVAVVAGSKIEYGRYRQRLRLWEHRYFKTAMDHKLKAFGQRRKADEADMMAESSLEMAKLSPATATESLKVAQDYRAQAARLRRLAVYEDTMGIKYEVGSKTPWFSVAPDPPEPE